MNSETDTIFHKENLSLDLKHLDVEDELGVWWDVRWCTSATVTKVSWDGDTTFTTDSKTGDTNIPALDDFTGAELELEWLSLLVC